MTKKAIHRLFEIALAGEEERSKLTTLNAEMIETVQKATAPRGTPPQTEVVSSEEGKALLSGEMDDPQLAAVWNGPLSWKIWALLLYLHGVSQAVIGGWIGVNKSTVCRWLDQVAEWAGYCLKDKKVTSSDKVAMDEKWVLIGGVFWYLFAAVDCVTGCPLHVALYPSNSGVYCKLFLLELKRLGYRPTIIITDVHAGLLPHHRAAGSGVSARKGWCGCRADSALSSAQSARRSGTQRAHG
jgi:hypothetical protein